MRIESGRRFSQAGASTTACPTSRAKPVGRHLPAAVGSRSAHRHGTCSRSRGSRRIDRNSYKRDSLGNLSLGMNKEADQGPYRVRIDELCTPSSHLSGSPSLSCSSCSLLRRTHILYRSFLHHIMCQLHSRNSSSRQLMSKSNLDSRQKLSNNLGRRLKSNKSNLLLLASRNLRLRMAHSTHLHNQRCLLGCTACIQNRCWSSIV